MGIKKTIFYINYIFEKNLDYCSKFKEISLNLQKNLNK